MLLSVDTETTGLDIFHGCRPFLISACDGKSNYVYTGEVNRHDRTVTWSSDTLVTTSNLFKSAYRLIFHNTNFDMRMLASIGLPIHTYWPKIEDTLVASHVLCSGDKHGLKDLAIKYLDYWDDDEHILQQSITSIRSRIQQSQLALSPSDPSYIRIAAEEDPHFPAAKNMQWWKQDMWLDIPLCTRYAICDVERTYLLWKTFYIGLLSDHLLPIYEFRRNLLPILYDMQSAGINIYVNKLDKLITHLTFQLEQIRLLLQEASKYPGPLNPDKPNDLRRLLYDILKLEVINSTPPSKTYPLGQPSTDEATLNLLEELHDDLLPIKYLQLWREINTELSFLTSYKLWTVHENNNNNTFVEDHSRTPNVCSSLSTPTIWSITDNNNGSRVISIDNKRIPNFRLHSSSNLTGTHWTRTSSNDPNQQNFKKSLHYLFGPPPGYYWLSFDLKNIELCLWAYDVKSPKLIAAFERGESVHMIIARIIRPHQIYIHPGNSSQEKEVAWKDADPEHGQYTATKGGTFARIYGGAPPRVNRTYGIPGACAIIDQYLPEVGRYAKDLAAEMKRLEPIYLYPSIFTLQGYRLDVPISKPYTVSSGRIQGSAALIIQDMLRQIVHHPTFKSPLHPQHTSWKPLPFKSPTTYIPSFSPTSCRIVKEVHDSLTFEIPQHEHYKQTNSILLSALELVGQQHIPTCGLESKVIFPTPDESFRVRIYRCLPERLKLDPGSDTITTFTYYFQDGWICEASSDDFTRCFTGPTQEASRQAALDAFEQL